MIEISEATLGLHLSNLMRGKLGPNLDWSVPEVRNIVGPFSLDVFVKYNENRKQIVNACREKLASLSDSELLILLDREIEDPDSVREIWNSFQRNKIKQLNEGLPPWYAGGFGHPDYVADFEYWAQIPYFSSHEALFMSLGVEPNSITSEQILKFSTVLEKGHDIWPALKYMLRRRDQIERQFPTAVFRNKIRSRDLFDWFELVKLDVHPNFKSLYLDEKMVGEIEAKPIASKRPHKRELDSICQLFTAMAIDYHGYDPTASRSPIPKEIGELAAGLGIEISDDTVRKYLKHGAKFISSDWKPE